MACNTDTLGNDRPVFFTRVADGDLIIEGTGDLGQELRELACTDDQRRKRGP
jgi:hypothetical protein